MVSLRDALKRTLAWALLLIPVEVRADHCDLPEHEASLDNQVSVSFEGASYRTSRYEGTYEGLSANYYRSFGDYGLRAAMPTYRLVRNGRSYGGAGDLFFSGSYTPLRFSEGRQEFGLALAVTLPTGNAEEDLGMGHVMLMPQVFGRLKEGPFVLSYGLGYGGAVTAGSSSHHHGAMPIVSPMNSSEITAQALGVWSLESRLRGRLGLSGALPTSSDGAARAIGTIGVEGEVGPFLSRVEVQTALVGDPFQFKLISSVGLRF